MYNIDGYNLFRNDATPFGNDVRPFEGMTVYSCTDYFPGYPYSCNSNGVEITAVRLMTAPHLYILGNYRLPRVPVFQLCQVLSDLLTHQSSQLNI